MDQDIRRRLVKIVALRTRGRQLGAETIVAKRGKIRTGKVGIAQREIAGMDPHMAERKQARRLAIRGAGAQTKSNRLISGIEPSFKPRDGVLGQG